MTQTLQFIPFRARSDKGWTEAWAIYENSFPPCERWHEEKYAEAFSDPHFEADGIWLGDRLAGILFFWKGEGFRYLEHLAVSPSLRGQDVGSRALTAFCAHGDRVILEIDPPVDDISRRRQCFYERIGFITNPYEYVHPSFRQPFHPHKLVLMSYPAALSEAEAGAFADFVRTVVLRYSDHEDPTLPRIGR